jgi:hypothetical protein
MRDVDDQGTCWLRVYIGDANETNRAHGPDFGGFTRRVSGKRRRRRYHSVPQLLSGNHKLR